MGGAKPKLARKGILMHLKITDSRCLRTRAITRGYPGEPLDELTKRVQDAVQRFRSASVTPQSFLDLENALHAASAEACRQVLEREANRLEPDDKSTLPGQV